MREMRARNKPLGPRVPFRENVRRPRITGTQIEKPGQITETAHYHWMQKQSRLTVRNCVIINHYV